MIAFYLARSMDKGRIYRENISAVQGDFIEDDNSVSGVDLLKLSMYGHKRYNFSEEKVTEISRNYIAHYRQFDQTAQTVYEHLKNVSAICHDLYQ